MHGTTQIMHERRTYVGNANLPAVVFWLVAIVVLGACATNAALGHFTSQPNRDLFQHVAALRALIENIQHPDNPFVASHESSRHFHPYWVAMAYAARTFGWTVWQTIGVASFLSMGVLATGIWVFAKTYYRSPWGPLALLLPMIASWSMPISHTGYHSISTFVEGASYPAVILIGLSLVFWALLIRSFENPRWAIALPPLVAFMMATHQLGAVLGFLVGGCIIFLWPSNSIRARIIMCAAIMAGLALAELWPYQSPLGLIFKAGNPTWRHGIDFFRPAYLIGIFIPSAVGLIGLFKPIRNGTGLPLLAASLILWAGFAFSESGFLIGTRFAPTAILLLHVGFGALLVRLFSRSGELSEKAKLALVSTLFGAALFQFIVSALYYYPREIRDQRRSGDVYEHSQLLTVDIPDSQPVAAYDVAAWPVAATGQKVLSVPWPEPMIHDLPARQHWIDELFDLRLSRAQRLALAKQRGIRTLILDRRFGPIGKWRRRQLNLLRQQSLVTRQSGPLIRFDLR